MSDRIKTIQLMAISPVEITINPCTCDECVNMCKHPCWPVPTEAQKLMDMGLASRLWLDRWYSDGELPDIYIVAPALAGYGGGIAPYVIGGLGLCTFLSEGRCALHRTCKPAEGRLVSCRSNGIGVHKAIAMLWNCRDGWEAVERWKELAGYDGCEE